MRRAMVTCGFVMGNVWLLAALALVVGRRDVPMYYQSSFFGVGDNVGDPTSTTWIALCLLAATACRGLAIAAWHRSSHNDAGREDGG